MNSKIPVALHPVCFKSMVSHALGALPSPWQKIVAAGQQDFFEDEVGENAQLIRTDGAAGVCAAISEAADLIKKSGTVLIMPGNMPLITRGTIEKACSYHVENGNAATFLSVSDTDFTKAMQSSKIYFFQTESLLKALQKNKNFQKADSLANIAEMLLQGGGRVGAFLARGEGECFEVCDRASLAFASDIMRKRIVKKHIEGGVTFIAPDTAYIGADVSIGRDTVIMPNVILEGGTSIGEGCVIGSNSRISNSALADGTEVESSVILSSEIGSGTRVGPFAYIRPGCRIGQNIKIGDFVEVKNSTIGDGTKISHLTYVGDSDVGKKVNFGCGTITVNYDGKRKYRASVGDDAFIGCNTNLISPVTIGEGAFIAAGSTITDNVPKGAFAIARSRQTVKTDWKQK